MKYTIKVLTIRDDESIYLPKGKIIKVLDTQRKYDDYECRYTTTITVLVEGK